jgi:hypothetical protein
MNRSLADEPVGLLARDETAPALPAAVKEHRASSVGGHVLLLLRVHDPLGGGGGGGGPWSRILFSTATVAGSRLASTVAVSVSATP